MMKVGIAADHGGFELKTVLKELIQSAQHHVQDFGAYTLDTMDDYPDMVIPLCQALIKGEIERGVIICGSGVGANIVANKFPGIRAALIQDCYSAHQGVEDDNMNVICLGGRVIAKELAWECISAFLSAKYQAKERFERRLLKITELEQQECIR